YHVYPNPQARFADDTNPDRPPMPPDDPASAEMAPNPQKPPHKAGVQLIEGTGYLDLLAQWDRENRAEATEKSKQALEPISDSQNRAMAAGDSDQPDDAISGGSPIRLASATEIQEKPEGQKPLAGAPAGSQITTSLSPSPGAPRPYLLKLEQAVELGLIN